MKTIKQNQTGFTLAMILATTGLFITIAIGMIELGVYQQKLYKQQSARYAALHMAEMGIQYYKWLLAHYPNEYFDKTGFDPGPAGSPYGPYIHSASSTTEELTGKYSLEITPPPTGSTIVTIKSTGWIDKYPNVKRTITARYGQRSLARYSIASNEGVNVGATTVLSGEFFSNTYIKMDGFNDSYIYDALSEYMVSLAGNAAARQASCNTSYVPNGCRWDATPAVRQCFCPGIWSSTANSNRNLWRFPTQAINYPSFTNNMNAMLNIASNSTACINCVANPPAKNYHITFNNDFTYTVREVTGTINVSKKLDTAAGCENSPEIINTQGAASTYTIQPHGVIFVMGNVWVDGVIKGKTTLVAARLPDNGTYKNIYINGNLNYDSLSGSSTLALIAQNSVIFPRIIPGPTADLTVQAILLAQNGRVYRPTYTGCAGSYSINSINLYGGMITNLQGWMTSGVDGFQNRTYTYDPRVTYNPPPFFPTEINYTFINWEETSTR